MLYQEDVNNDFVNGWLKQQKIPFMANVCSILFSLKIFLKNGLKNIHRPYTTKLLLLLHDFIWEIRAWHSFQVVQIPDVPCASSIVIRKKSLNRLLISHEPRVPSDERRSYRRLAQRNTSVIGGHSSVK